MSKSLLRSALELRSPITRLPPTFLLPIRARWLSGSTPQHAEPGNTITSSTIPPPPTLEASRSQQTSTSIHAHAQTQTSPSSSPPSSPSTILSEAAPAHPNTPRSRGPPTAPQPRPAPTGPVPQSVRDLLPFLRAQPSHYITVHVHGRPYLVTPGDTIRLPFLMPGVSPGDVLRLDRASVLGSRDFTLLPPGGGADDNDNVAARREGGGFSKEVAYIDERVFECRAVVAGVEAEPMRLKEKTKRRNRKVKTVRSKHKYTVLRVTELKVKAPEEIEE